MLPRQIKVDEESPHLLAFGTPLGRYHLKRLPYGIHSASEVFQREITSIIILDVTGSANSQDDIIVWARALAKHNERLNKVFLKIKSGLKLNEKKCQIGAKSIVFLRHISSEGAKVDPSKIEAITKIP